jgi:hypothetical protein
MAAAWQTVAFPLILPWRRGFWTLPAYFPGLVVGVTQGWPPEAPYQGLPLPPEAEAYFARRHQFRAGDLRQWRAFQDYQEGRETEGDLLRAIRFYGLGDEGAPAQEELPPPWPLAWQLEKMEADQEAQMLLVDQGQEWLEEILAPEPWEEQPSYRPAPGVGELPDPDLARLRYHLWRRVMGPHIQDPWAPLLLGRASRALFLALRGWPEAPPPRTVQVALPGCQTGEELSAVLAAGDQAGWRQEFGELLSAALAAAGQGPDDLEAAAARLHNFAVQTLEPGWPFASTFQWTLEIWAADPEERPVLVWGASAGARKAGLGGSNCYPG